MIQYGVGVANRYEKAAGIVERTSAELGEWPWTLTSEKRIGYLFAANFEGANIAAFEVAPGQIILTMSADNIVAARRTSGVVNIVVEVTFRSSDGSGDVSTLGIRGPKGRVSRIFDYLGFPL